MTSRGKHFPLPLAAEWRLIGYSSGNLGKNFVLSGVDTTLLFMMTDVLHITPLLVGRLMLIVLAGDLLFDLLFGLLASWCQPLGIGYRRLIFIGSAPCGLAFAALCGLPALGIRAMPVIAVVLLGFRFAYAAVDVPHNSLLASITVDSRARGRVSGYRLFFSSLSGVAIATILTPAVEQAASGYGAHFLLVVGIGGGILFCTSMAVANLSSSGGDNTADLARTPLRLLPHFDAPFLTIVVLAGVTGFALPMFGRMVFYLSRYALGQPNLAGHMLLALTAGQFAGVLAWTLLTRCRDKTQLLAASHAVVAVGLAVFSLLGDAAAPLLIVTVVIGCGLAGVFMLPWGIVADLIDFAEFRHGERRQTATFASILVILKASAACSAVTISWTLDLLGYSAGAAPSAVVVTGIRALALGAPILGALVAIAALAPLAMGHNKHARIMQGLYRRRRVASQGSSGSSGSTRIEETEGLKTNSNGDRRALTLPG